MCFAGGGVGKNVEDNEMLQLGKLVGAVTTFGEVLTDNEGGFDLTGGNVAFDLVKLFERIVVAEDKLGAGGVGVAVGADELAIGFAEAADENKVVGAEGLFDFFDEKKFLVGAARGSDDGDFIPGETCETKSGFFHCFLHRGGGVLAAAAGERGGQAEVGVNFVESETMAVGHPSGVDLVVFARSDAEDFVAASPNGGVAAGAAVDVDGRSFLEEPDPHLEAEVVAGQRADGTDVDGVETVVVVELAAGVDGKGGVGSAIGESENGVVGDFVHEADTAAAHDAALVIEANARSDIDVLGLLDFVFLEAGDAFAVLDREFLERAFAGLVANGAIERVIDEEKLHHAFAASFDEFAGGADSHVFADRVCTGDDGAGHPADFLEAVFAVSGVGSGSGAWGHPHLHQAHTTVAGRGEFGVIAVVRDLLFSLFAGLDHAGSFGHLNPVAVDLNINQALLGGEVLGQWLGGRR